MVQLVTGLLHRHEQRSAQRFSPVCQRWHSRSSDAVVITHSTKCNAHGPFLNAFQQVCLSYFQTGMPHLAGVFDDRTYDCDIYFEEMVPFFSITLE